MNIVAILANGIGSRFKSNVPKQFHKINGKMVIEYVTQAILSAKSVDKVVIVTNVQANGSFLSGLLRDERTVMTDGGSTRNRSLKNALEFINSNFECEKLIVCDSVRPMITGELIDKYFELLDSSKAVVTAQKITDSLGCYDIEQVYRDRYYLMQSPEAFDFKTLYGCFDSESKLTEVTQQLPKGSKIELFFDFTNNFKLTYPADLKYLEALINARDNKVDYSEIFNGVTRLNRYLFENYPSQTKSWRRVLENEIPGLLNKWQITDYHIIKTSHFGIIFLADSVKYGDCVLKIIPPFIDRYEQEKNCYRHLPSQIMCEMYDYDDNCSALLLKKLDGDIDESNTLDNSLFEFFESAVKSYVAVSDCENYHNYADILKSKTEQCDFEYKSAQIHDYVCKAEKLFSQTFSSEEQVLIHGDLHKYNIMKSADKIYAIDPIGYIAPFETDIARYIGTQLTDAEPNERKEILDELSEYFSPLSSKEKIKSALFCDIVFRTHNSIFENDSFELTDKWLDILDNLF